MRALEDQLRGEAQHGDKYRTRSPYLKVQMVPNDTGGSGQVPGYVFCNAEGIPLRDSDGRMITFSKDLLRELQQSAQVFQDPDAFEDGELQKILQGGFSSNRGILLVKAKYKAIASMNMLWCDECWRPMQPKRYQTLTAVAPNLRLKRDGRIPEDPADYSAFVDTTTDTPKLKVETFKTRVKELIRFQLECFEAMGVKHVVLPAFGGGAFSVGFQPDYSRCMAEAYKEILQEYEFPFDEIHFALPTIEQPRGVPSNHEVYSRVFADYNEEIPVSLTQKDTTGVIRVLAQSGIDSRKIGELNPGNGEHFVGNGWRGTARAYDECRARNSLMIVAQDTRLNPALIARAPGDIDLIEDEEEEE